MKLLKRKYFLLFATKLTEEIPDPCNAEEQYQSFIREKNTKSVKQSKIITQRKKIFKIQTLLT